MFLFFVKMPIFDNFWIKHFTKCRFFGLILIKTFPSMIVHENSISSTNFYLKRSELFYKSEIVCQNSWNAMTITLKWNMLETWNLCQNVQFWIFYCIFLITRFWSKVDLGLFGNYRMTFSDMFRIDLESISFLRWYCHKFMLGVKVVFEELVEARIFFCILFLCKCFLRQNWLW